MTAKWRCRDRELRRAAGQRYQFAEYRAAVERITELAHADDGTPSRPTPLQRLAETAGSGLQQIAPGLYFASKRADDC